MPRSKSSVLPPEHKTENTGSTVKYSKQESFDAMHMHSHAMEMLRQNAAKVECSHVLEMEKYARKHAIVMKHYADEISEVQMGLDALCQYHGETFED